jgi:predicted O-methyltransferase YrrM
MERRRKHGDKTWHWDTPAMKSSGGDRRGARATTAEDVRRYVDRLYEQGHLEGSDGSHIALDPHALAEVDAREIRGLAVSEGVGATLEVGLGLGLGTLSLCEALLEVGRPGAQHVVVEGFPDDFGGAGSRTVRAAGVDGMVEFVHEESQLALPRFAGEGRCFDLALIDGDHRFEGVFLDLCFADRLVRPRGLVIVDDLWMPAIRLAVSYVERNLGWGLLPGAMTRAFKWRRFRNLPGRRLRGVGDIAVLRRPAQRPDRGNWDRFVPFT